LAFYLQTEADPDPVCHFGADWDPAYHFDADADTFNLMRIHADLDHNTGWSNHPVPKETEELLITKKAVTKYFPFTNISVNSVDRIRPHFFKIAEIEPGTVCRNYILNLKCQ
jgi:hypothetical protein